jgi:uncharacterized protein (TIGR03067 family)
MVRNLSIVPLSSVVLIGMLVVQLTSSRAVTGGKDKEEVVSAQDLTRAYAENPAEFDKKYKDKVVTVEGMVSATSVKASGKSFLMIEGYTKPGDTFSHSVRCEESGPDFEGIRIGHKVRIRGTAQGHSPTLVAAELRTCKVMKVFADDYPPSKAAREEVKKLQGKWKVVSGEAEGKKLEPQQAGFDAINFEGYTAYLHHGKQSFSFGVALDPSKTPKTIDLVGGKATLPCIYTLDGDQFRLVLPPPPAKDKGFSRADSFDTTKSKGLVLNAEREK